MGQSNMAAGATIGSNHNSRSPDGEIVAGRGFWPGLCVSLKHNSRFASFTILAKGDYPAELDIPIPFSLISNDVSKDELMVMPAYWFLHNMYALARNSWKYTDRDKRIDKTQLLEFDFLAPDTIGEMVAALTILEKCTGLAVFRAASPSVSRAASPSVFRAASPSVSHGTAAKKRPTDEELARLGADLLLNSPDRADELEILAEGWENGDRKVRLTKVSAAYNLFRQLISYYTVTRLLDFIQKNPVKTFDELLEALPTTTPFYKWVNAGGQLIRESELKKLIGQIHSGKVRAWEQVHQFYTRQGEQYAADRLVYALAALRAVTGPSLRKLGRDGFAALLRQSIATREWMTKEIYASRAKDYTNPFRKMVYDSPEEMNAVVGRLQDNAFIKQEKEAAKKYRKDIEKVLLQFGL
jgi:hypothetical protein